MSTAPGGGGESITGGDESNASRTACKERLRLLMQFSSFYFPSFMMRLLTSPLGGWHAPQLLAWPWFRRLLATLASPAAWPLVG